MRVSDDDKIVDSGGELEAYGLSPKPDDDLSEIFPYVTVCYDEPVIFECIEIQPGVPIDIHVIPQKGSRTILLLATGKQTSEMLRMQQKLNETSLNFETAASQLTETRRTLRQGTLQFESLLGDVVHGLDVLMLERCGDRSFIIVGTSPNWIPTWYPGLMEERSPFDPSDHIPYLDLFMEEAEAVWDQNLLTELRSDPWQEQAIKGQMQYFRARALSLDGRAMLFIRPAPEDFHEKQVLLQTARKAALAHRDLEKEIQKKDVLLHCIVHDLKNPLTAITSIFQLLQIEDDETERAEMLELGASQVEKQSAMIQDILAAFTAEYDDWNPEELTESSAPDIVDMVNDLSRSMARAFELKKIRLDVLKPPSDDSLSVMGESRQLDRVLANLMENGLRHTPDSGVFRISISIDADKQVVIEIEDSGSGVPEKAREHLFKKFSQGDQISGSSGLGLYFCRITVEKWGGSIAYFDSELGGAGFRITLLPFSAWSPTI